MIRTRNQEELNKQERHLDIVCCVSKIKNYYSKRRIGKYDYDIGEERPIWTWYELLNVDYDDIKHEIIEDKSKK